MLNPAEEVSNLQEREIIYRTKGQKHGPLTRLVSPGDLGELIKPFVFLDSFSIESPKAVNLGYHPHSGIVTVSTFFEGGFTYEDSTNKSGVLHSGDVEWMQAGGGVWHTGSPLADEGAKITGFQLWLALPEALENQPALSLYIESELIPEMGPARVIVGEYAGVSSPLPEVAPIIYLHVHLQDGESWTFNSPDNHGVLWLAVNEGNLKVAGQELADEIAVFDSNSGDLSLEADGETNFVLGSAIKHPYPLVTGYYSVHTNEEALRIGEEGITKVGSRLKSEGKI